MKSMKLLGVVFVIVMTTAASAGLYFPRPDLINRQSAACRPDFDHPPRCLTRRFDDASQDLLADMVLAGPSALAGFLPDDWAQTMDAGSDARTQPRSTLRQAGMVQETSAQ